MRKPITERQLEQFQNEEKLLLLTDVVVSRQSLIKPLCSQGFRP